MSAERLDGPQALASFTGIAYSVARKILLGETWPELENLSKIALAFRVDIADLFYKGKPPRILERKPTISEVIASIEDALIYKVELGPRPSEINETSTIDPDKTPFPFQD